MFSLRIRHGLVRSISPYCLATFLQSAWDKSCFDICFVSCPSSGSTETTTTMLILLTSVMASIVWVVFCFLNEWRLWWGSPPGSKLPPMPPWTSIRGHVELLREDFHRNKCIEWAKKYGPVLRLNVNLMNVVILNDFENIKKFCNTKELLWRSHSFSGYRDNYRGLGQLNGKAWTANRRFCLSMLRDLGFAKTAMEGHMMEEFRRVADSIGNANGKPLDVMGCVMPCTFNNIVSFFYGGVFTHDHPTRPKLHRLINRVGSTVFPNAAHQFLPKNVRRILGWIPFTRDHRIAQVLAELDTFSKEQIQAYKSANYGDETGDFIHGYTRKIQECRGESEPLFTDDYLVGNVNSFLMAGTFSTTTAMTWQMINFAQNPDTVQARVQREIDDVIGQERMPTWEDRKRMPYTMACIWELERRKTGAPLGVARECAEDVVVGDIYIPKGTIVIPNIWAVHNDPILWKDPTKFHPERYLSEDGKTLLPKPEHLIPFSIGHRSCAGETFARMEIFLIITFLLQKYHVTPEQPININFDNPDTSILKISHIKLRFLPRNIGKNQ
ncbi:vitamin D 25-hydroxylase isoform X1 [Rhipicephalus microplus]|uniref:vitamin D 25-hydroxylase isoform X1 n=1 Tax=Rhipicephalus microplus TaxID=6941 RepID=UPI003F6AB3B2